MSVQFKFVDLSHLLTPEIPTWEGKCGFQTQTIQDYQDAKSQTKFRVQTLNMQAGIGTHIDAPLHCIPKGQSTAEIPLTKLIVPCFILPVHKLAKEDYMISTGEIEAMEKKLGRIPKHSFVIGFTGWFKYWQDSKAYRAVDKKGAVHCPGFSTQAIDMLLEREVVGVGIDTMTIDGSNKDFPGHQKLLENGKYIIENMTNLHMLPVKGAYVMALPLKMKEATQAPVRAVGMIPYMPQQGQQAKK